MREFLFRGKDVDTGKWVYGGYCKHDKVKVCFTTDDPKTKYMIIVDGSCDWGFEPPLQGYEVDPNTVGQFTGLTDKTGKLVFEGDIVDIIHQGIYKCRWDECNFEFGFSNGNESFGIAYVSPHDFVVVGNIYDDPEMLEE